MLNTFKYTKQLEDTGFSRAQAEMQLQVIAEIMEDNLATKRDLHLSVERMEHKMLQMEYRMTIKMGTMLTIAVGVLATINKLF